MMIIPNWPAPKNVKALSSTRVGGFSQGEYLGLNLGTHVGDDPQVVMRNRQELVALSAMPSAPIWLNQTHSTVVAEASKPTDVIVDADGLMTSSVGVVCSAMTADCLPVLLANRQGTQVAAVHAGWRGLVDGILENALAQFEGDVMAWLGPAIGPTAFEVGAEVRAAFCDADVRAAQAFMPMETAGKFLADLPLLAKFRLERAGIEQVYASDLCTYSDPKRFYSYRRDGVTGRQASFIWLDAESN